MSKRTWLVVLGASALAAAIWAAAIFIYVFPGTTSDTSTSYYPNGFLKAYGGKNGPTHGLYCAWTENGEFSESESGSFYTGFRYRALSRDERQRLTAEDFRNRLGMNRLSWALSKFRSSTGKYPATWEDLLACSACMDELMGSRVILRDAWGRTFRLKFESDRYSPVPGALYPVVYTLGADDQVGGTGTASDHGIKLAYLGVEELTDFSVK